MTVFDAHAKITHFLMEKHSISMPDDLVNIVGVSENPEETEAAIQLSLDELVELKVLRKYVKTYTNKTPRNIYVLSYPYEKGSQQVTIPNELGMEVADVINEFSEIVQDDELTACALNITAEDIMSLISIIRVLMEKIAEYEGNGQSEDGNDQELA